MIFLLMVNYLLSLCLFSYYYRSVVVSESVSIYSMMNTIITLFQAFASYILIIILLHPA